MKKTLFILLLTMATLHVAAQDTLRMPINPPANYYSKLAEWMLDTPMATHLRIHKYSYGREQYVMAVGFPLSSPLRVVGLAGLFDTISWGSYGGTPQITLEDLGPEYMFLYQPRPDTQIPVAHKYINWNGLGIPGIV